MLIRAVCAVDGDGELPRKDDEDEEEGEPEEGDFEGGDGGGAGEDDAVAFVLEGCVFPFELV